MAMLMGMMGSVGSSAASSSSVGGGVKGRRRSGGRGGDVVCAATGALTDQYRTLKIQPGSSETEVKKAFRKLALQYHPDVCKGNNCTVQFHRINEAYDMILDNLRHPEEQGQWQWGSQEGAESDEDDEYTMRGMGDPDYELWEEWMGWEGAGIRDYTSHINPYL